METYGLEKLGILAPKAVYRNLGPAQLTEAALRRGEGKLSNTGALVVTTGMVEGEESSGYTYALKPGARGTLPFLFTRKEPRHE